MVKEQMDAIMKKYGPEGDNTIISLNTGANCHIPLVRYEYKGWSDIAEDVMIFLDRNNGLEWGVDVGCIDSYDRDTGTGKYRSSYI